MDEEINKRIAGSLKSFIERSVIMVVYTYGRQDTKGIEGNKKTASVILKTSSCRKENGTCFPTFFPDESLRGFVCF